MNEEQLSIISNFFFFFFYTAPYNAVKKDVLVIQNTTTNKFVFKVSIDTPIDCCCLICGISSIGVKIKTTSPKVFCVKPNCGFIGPAGTEFDTVEVACASKKPKKYRC